ncbi:MAG: T9SS type A sorting domain-containing protein [Bacteroidetes bacterium]|nr:MAG: T9SS type A sorting domain-containing protein [Bacteroidota bacterium]
MRRNTRKCPFITPPHEIFASHKNIVYLLDKLLKNLIGLDMRYSKRSTLIQSLSIILCSFNFLATTLFCQSYSFSPITTPSVGTLNNLKCAQGNNIFLSTSTGLYRTDNQGITWDTLTLGLGTISVNDVLRISDSLLIIGTANSGVFRSTNGGLSWIQINNSINDLRIYCLAYSKELGLYCGTGDGVFRTIDTGNTWHKLAPVFVDSIFLPPQPFYGSTYSIDLHPSYGILMTNAWGCYGVYLSNNLGITWIKIAYHCNGSLDHGSNGDAVFDSINQQILFYENWWERWTKGTHYRGATIPTAPNPQPVNYYSWNNSTAVCFRQAPNRYLYFSTTDTLWESKDNGFSWGVAALVRNAKSIIFDNNLYLYCIDGNNILLRSNTPLSIPSVPDILPSAYSLDQNYPNPFNPSTVIHYQLPAENWVTLKIYNILGKEVATIIDENQVAGYKSVEWDASHFSSGVYFYRMTAGVFQDVKKLLLLK